MDTCCMLSAGLGLGYSGVPKDSVVLILKGFIACEGDKQESTYMKVTLL